MEEFAAKILGPLGLSGLVIFVLSITVYHLYRALTKANEARIGDVTILVKALENNTQATRENAAAIVARNQITEELGRSIERQASIFELFMQKNDLHDEALKDKLQNFKMAIDAFSESMRTNTAIVRDVRDHVDSLVRSNS